MANPAITSLNVLNAGSPVRPPANTKRTTPMPSSPRLPTDRPITAPPLKAMRSALPCPRSRAASDVRTLASVAAFIPKNPASSEHRAPPMYAAEVGNESSATYKRTATMMMNGMSTEYSRLKNALAPSRIRDASSAIRSVPIGCRLRYR